MYEETQNNQEESKELSEKTRRNIVNEFEKENTCVLKKMKSIFSEKQDEKEKLSGQSSSIRSRHEADKKRNANLLLEESLTKALTPIARRTRSNIAAAKVDIKCKKRYGLSGFKKQISYDLDSDEDIVKEDGESEKKDQ